MKKFAIGEKVEKTAGDREDGIVIAGFEKFGSRTMQRTGVDRRPGVKVPVKKSKRLAHLARSGPAEESLLTSSSMVLASLIAAAVLYGCDSYFFDGYYGGGAWKIFHQIAVAFHF